jgi:hypothetical protein
VPAAVPTRHAHSTTAPALTSVRIVASSWMVRCRTSTIRSFATDVLTRVVSTRVVSTGVILTRVISADAGSGNSCIFGGTVARWHGGTVARWHGGTVARWLLAGGEDAGRHPDRPADAPVAHSRSFRIALTSTFPLQHTVPCPRGLMQPRRRPVPTVVAALIAAATFAAAPASAQQPGAPSLAGKWTLDATRSDDAMKKLEEAVNAPAAGAMNTATTRGVAAGRAGTRGGAGAAGGGSANSGSAARMPTRGPAAALLSAETLTVELGDGTVIYGLGEQNPLLLHPGMPMSMNRWGMDGVEVRTELRGNRLTIDSRGPGNLRVQERYELKNNGEIEANISMSLPGITQQVRIKRVYTAAQ